MNKKIILGLAAGAMFATAVLDVGAAGSVSRTAENCMNAHAILMASQDGNHSRYWEAINTAVRSQVGRFEIVGDYEPGISRKVSFRQYDTRFQQGGTAYVAHCGHGATCNDLADYILKVFPEVGSPGVYCGEVPHILENPTSGPN
jgi:hypothetical protein